MNLTPIQVECYAGTKADETPRRFVWEGQTIEVGDVLDRWYQVESNPEWPPTTLKCEPRMIANTC